MLRILSVSSEAEFISCSFLQEQNELQASLARYLFPVGNLLLKPRAEVSTTFPSQFIMKSLLFYLILLIPQKPSILRYETPPTLSSY